MSSSVQNIAAIDGSSNILHMNVRHVILKASWKQQETYACPFVWAGCFFKRKDRGARLAGYGCIDLLLNLRIEPMNAGTILLDAVDTRWKKYRTELKACRAEFSSEAVHDLRVAVRRLLAIFDLLRSVIHHPRIQKIRHELKGQLDHLDELRDVQVMLADISEFVHEVPELIPFYGYLQKREGKLLRAARKQIKSLKTGSLAARVEKVRGMVDLLPEQNIKENLLEHVDGAYMHVLHYYAMIDVEKPTTIHRLRIAFKKFRYMIEIIHPILEGFPDGNFQIMHDYQGMMGNIQDMEASLQHLSDFADSKFAANIEIIQEYYIARLKQSLYNYLEDKGELLNFWRTSPDQSIPWES